MSIQRFTNGDSMLNYIVRRILYMIPTLFVILCVTFFVLRLAPGDPALMKVHDVVSDGTSGALSSKALEESRSLYGLDEPIYVQFGKWMYAALHFDFGVSYRDHKRVSEKIFEALPITLTLNIISILIIYAVSIPTGVISALKPKTMFDRFSALLLFMLYSLPSFWVAMLLIIFLGGGDYLNWFPITGVASQSIEFLPWYGKIGNVLWHIALPVVCLSYGGFAFLSRFTRTSVLEVIRQDYIRTARANGLSRWRVVIFHGLRNALVPLLSLASTLLPALIGGSVIIEQIFSISGMGRLGFESVLARDYPVIMAIALISAVLTLVSILLTDIMYVVVDPRIRFGKK